MKHSSKRTAIALALVGAFAAGAAHADARGELIDAFQKVIDDGSYRMTMDAESRRGSTKMEMLVQLPDRFHMKNEGGEFIVLPAGTWMNAGGQWMKMPMNMSKMIAGYSADAMKQGMAAIQDVSYVGEETAEGCSAKRYRYSARGEFMGVKNDSESDVWICQDDGLPVRIVSNERGKTDKVTIVYDWDAPVNIKAPN